MSGLSITVRPAQPHDLEALCRLYAEFHEFHAQGVPSRLLSLGDPAEYDCSELIQGIQQIMNRSDAALFAAEADAGVCVGLAEVYLRKDEGNSAKPALTFGYLQSLIVIPAFRRHGVATQLVCAAQEWSGRQGASEMQVEIWEFDAGPLPFYAALGYKTLRRTLVRPL